MSTDPRPASSTASAPRSSLRWQVIALGIIAVLGAWGVREWQTRQLEQQTMLPGRAPDPVWVQRENDVQGRVTAALGGPPELDEKPPHTVTPVPSNAQPDLSAFVILQDHRTYDLRGWRPVSTGDGPHTAGVVMTRRLKLSKRAAAERIDFLTRTSGTDLVVRCVGPRADKAQVYASQAKPVVAGKEMIEQRLSADVAQEPIGNEFDLTYRTTYWNSLQTLDEQWFGTIGSDGSTLLSMLILFPQSKPFQGGRLQTGPADGELAPYDGTRLVFKGPRDAWTYWEVPGPKTGNIYRFDWKW
jgi:hypothetical protein